MLNSRLLVGLFTCLWVLMLTLPTRSAVVTTCYGSACNGQNPFTTGCANDAYVVGTVLVRDAYNVGIGDVTFYWSDTCQAGYTQTTAFDTAALVIARTYLSSSVYSTVSGTNTISATSNLISGSSSSVLSSCGTIRLGAIGGDTGKGEGCVQ